MEAHVPWPMFTVRLLDSSPLPKRAIDKWGILTETRMGLSLLEPLLIVT